MCCYTTKKTSPKAVKLQVCNLTSVSFRRHFLVFSRAEHMKLFLCTSDADFVSVELLIDMDGK